MRINNAWTILLLSFLLTTAQGSGQGTANELDDRSVTPHALRAKIDALTKEQMFLMFQKEMLASDSKYLLLDVSAKTGQLKYKNRVLKDFRFLATGNVSVHTVRSGMIALSEKTEGKRGRHSLRFGDVLILQGKRAVVPPDEKNIPVITLDKRDLQSVFYAVESGALAYVLR